MKMLITTWDKSCYILNNFRFMAEKYMPEMEIEIIGYTNFSGLGRKYKCVSVGDSQEFWASDLYRYIKSIEDEFVIMGTDDLLITAPIDYEVFSNAMEYMRDNKNVGRYELGNGHHWHEQTDNVKQFDGWNIYAYGEKSLYRISTQFSVWRTAYLQEYLNNKWDAWQFELQGSEKAKTDGKMIIATSGKVAMKYTHSVSTTRYPGYINVKGIRLTDVNEMLQLGLLEKGKMIFGDKENSPLYE